LYPELFRLGSFTLTSYTALVDVGLIGGTVVAYLQARRRGLGAAWVLDAALVTALGGLIGARAVYVAANWAYYGDYVHRALRLWEGGLAWHGGLAGGLIAGLAYCAIRRASPRLALDVLTPGAALLAMCAWLGCLLHGCAYGLETYPGQGLLWALSLELPDLYGIQAPRVAVQLLGAGWSAVALVAAVIAGRRTRFEGLLFPLWLAMYGVGSFGLGFLRADETLTVSGWRADQVADLALALTGTIVLVRSMFRKRQPKEKRT
jgi:phosphatidylglycerol:prolipoprotein diacylglycerol transferase